MVWQSFFISPSRSSRISSSPYFFVHLEIDDEFTLDPPSSLIMDDIVVLPMEETLNVVRQNMHTSANELVSGSRVIIDDLLIHSTFFKAYICSC